MEEQLENTSPEQINHVPEKVLPTIDKAMLIESLHSALDSYPVQIYNGHEYPVSKSLPEALTSITFDLKKVKGQMIDNNELLTGMRERKALVKSVSNAFSSFSNFLGLKSKWMRVFHFAQTAVALYGLFQIFMKIFFPDVPVPIHFPKK